MIERVEELYCITVKAGEIKGMTFPEIFRYWMGECVDHVCGYDVFQSVYDPVADEFYIEAEVYWVGDTGSVGEPEYWRRDEDGLFI